MVAYTGYSNPESNKKQIKMNERKFTSLAKSIKDGHF